MKANRKVTPTQLVKQMKEIVAVIHSLESTDKGDFDDPRQLAFDEMVSMACTLEKLVYRQSSRANDAQMAYAMFWGHFNCHAEELQIAVQSCYSIALMISRHIACAPEDRMLPFTG